MVNDRFVGEITATRLPGDLIRLGMLMPGPLRVSRNLLDQGDPKFIEHTEDSVAFRGVNSRDEPVTYTYRIVGVDESGPDGGWVLCEPVP